MGVFQILWVYYGLLFASRPVIAWNLVAVVINFLSVAAYRPFSRIDKTAGCQRVSMNRTVRPPAGGRGGGNEWANLDSRVPNRSGLAIVDRRGRERHPNK